MSNLLSCRAFRFVILILLGLCLMAYAAPTRSFGLRSHTNRRSIRGRWMRMIMEAVTKEDEQAFSSYLSDIVIGERLPKSGTNSIAAYEVKGTYKGHDGDNLVIKILPGNSTYTWGEAKALRAIGDLVDSGTIMYAEPHWLSSRYLPAVVIKKMPGKILEHIPAYMHADPKQKESFRREIAQQMCQKVAAVADNTRVIHKGNHKRNVLITLKDDQTLTGISSVELVDYGWPGTFFADENVNQADVKKQALEDCKEEWVNQWVEDRWEHLRND
ncbi:hypothetical protein DFJ43DRAFT_80352 [Lentinula guzmanii]|uniref:Protein kinase domain-containing protein n=1 Tax=Lentinula guzmanii TaxID=2804957 RepID=A0AA38JEA9_9AGAR|nr:hypothetical protein DFJ43DRAFT_80352 [Lentinula guzmanii]